MKSTQNVTIHLWGTLAFFKPESERKNSRTLSNIYYWNYPMGYTERPRRQRVKGYAAYAALFSPTPEQKVKAGLEAKNWYLGYVFLRTVDKKRYEKLMKYFDNDYAAGI